MASGQPVVQLIRVLPLIDPNGAYLAHVAGGSTPVERYSVWTFPDASQRYVDFFVALKGYGGGGITLRHAWMSPATSGNNCVWQAAFRRIGNNIETLTASHSYDFNTVTGASSTTARRPVIHDITFTNGADMDSLADGEFGVLRITRNPAHASDNLGNTAELIGWAGFET